MHATGEKNKQLPKAILEFQVSKQQKTKQKTTCTAVLFGVKVALREKGGVDRHF